ncbi:ubiquitinyl hydrolase 1 [Malassezia yamatoensis]|uniref:Ubiquitin carboxyl-terminal hydrolase n=1 Tax=Malassezia yamatoensis TaxID=253288 RepID=A0AAJ5YTK4_9BASI|nr:ubiquitinyl hydrolase 1 [Malassezia yamatoensis]
MSSWVPLEANPELFHAWSAKLGLDTQECEFYDVYGLDEELLSMVPQPVHAVLLLFPLSPKIEERHRSEDETYAESLLASEILWFKQTIGNACGTIGLLHAIANSPANTCILPDTPLAHLLDQARKTTPEHRTMLLQDSTALKSAHAAIAGEGQTVAPEAQDPVNLHFVAFVRGSKGQLWELDGRRKGPVERPMHVPHATDLLRVVAQFVQTYYVCY